VVSEEMLFKEIVDARTHGRWTTDNGPSQKLTLSTLCSGELKKVYLGLYIMVDKWIMGKVINLPYKI